MSASVAAADESAGLPQATFAECASATTHNVFSNNASSVDLSLNVDPGNSKQDSDFTLDVSQIGGLTVGSFDDPKACTGSVKVKENLQLRAGAFVESVPGISAQIVISNETLQAGDEPEAAASGSFSFAKACKVAKQLVAKGRKPFVQLSVIETDTYLQPGYPAISAKSSLYGEEALSCNGYSGNELVPAGFQNA